MEPSVLALGDLQIQGGTLAINDNRSRVEELLTCAVVGGEAAHHAEGEEELHGLRLRSIAQVDRAAEGHSLEVNFRQEEIEHGPYEVRDVLVESQRRKLVARTSRRR